MIQAMMAGVASIEAQQTRMNVIGNDLANINTTAFKSQDVNFEDLISQQVSGATSPTGNLGGTNGEQVGLGVQVGSTTSNMSQGSLSATSDPSDMAIQGNGFFMVGNGTSTSYTRDGTFEIDSAGSLVSADTGQKVLGWSADSDGTIDTTAQVTPTSSISIPVGSLDAAQATQNVSLAGNLNSAAASTDSTSVTTTVYDSSGTSHDVTIVYSDPSTPTAGSGPTGATSQWQWTAYSGDSASGTAIGSSTSTGNTPVYFNASGTQVSSLASGTYNTISLPSSGTGGTASTINLNMSSMQQLAAQDQVAVTSQDGFPPGTLQGFTVGLNGVITGSFSNGLERALGQVALANFSNPSGLSQTGSNLYVPSANSGVATVGVANQGTMGTINSGFLEQSNVDLSTSLTNLIITQRGFEANTKIVSTVDQLMQTLIDMKH
jgi:flagellar hook protein FlgE